MSAKGDVSGYYRRGAESGVFEPTEHSRSNWDPAIQHGSPPLALLTKHLDQLIAGTPQRIGRITLDILGAVPVRPVRVRAWVERPGRRIALLVAEMTAVDDARPVARATAWAVATTDTTDVASDRYAPLAEGPRLPLPPDWWGQAGYIGSVDWRRQEQEPTGAVFWLTARGGELVADEPTTPLEKMTLVVDSANGVGAVLDPKTFVYMNVDTAVHLHRLPVGDDFGLRARASIGPDGIGVTNSEIFDRSGFIGTCAQSLIIQRRGT